MGPTPHPDLSKQDILAASIITKAQLQSEGEVALQHATEQAINDSQAKLNPAAIDEIKVGEWLLIHRGVFQVERISGNRVYLDFIPNPQP